MFVLSIVFLFFNPYSNRAPSKEVLSTVSFLVLLPSFLAVITVFSREAFLMVFYGVWFLPITFYLGIVAISSVWNLYILFLIGYFSAVFWMKKE